MALARLGKTSAGKFMADKYVMLRMFNLVDSQKKKGL
jgi:hypothetical protein